MKREKRRVRVARRQKLLAEVSQRAAMRGLADALAEENRTAALAERSRALTQVYGGRSRACDGARLEGSLRFAGALASLATDAEAARADAAQQTVWQAQALGQAQTRARRQSERLENAVTAYRQAQERRDHDPSMTAPGTKGSRAANRLACNVQCEKPDPAHVSAPRPEARQPRTAP